MLWSEYVHLCSYIVFNMELQQTNQIRALWSLVLLQVPHSVIPADICSLQGSCPQRPLPQPAQEKAQPCGFWTGRQGCRAGKHRLLLSKAASPFAGLNFQPKTRKEGRWWDVDPSCVKMQYSRGYEWEGIGQALLLVLANKHINSKVDNQVGWGGWRGSGVKSSSEGAVMASTTFEPGWWGRGGTQKWSPAKSLEFQALGCSSVWVDETRGNVFELF